MGVRRIQAIYVKMSPNVPVTCDIMISWKYKGQPLNKQHNIQGKSLLLPL